MRRINNRITLEDDPPRLVVQVPATHIQIAEDIREGYTVTVALSPLSICNLRKALECQNLT